MKHIVFTRFDQRGVAICTPTRELFERMSIGGCEGAPSSFIEEQVFLQMKAGIKKDHAIAFAKAITFGGVPEREVYELVKDRDCARFGTLHELQDTDELPFDRWFRDAWRRSANGGPIGIDLEKAKDIHWEKIFVSVEAENRMRMMSRKKRDLFELNDDLRSMIDKADDVSDLRKIWPEGLSGCSPLSLLS